MANAEGKSHQAAQLRLAGSHRLRGAVFIVLGGICWGFSGTCIEYLTQGQGVPIAWASFLRLAISAAILLALCLARPSRRAELACMLRDRPSWCDLVLYAVFGSFGCQFTYLVSISITSAGVATLMEQVGLVLVVFVACIRLRRAPRLRELAALALALAGMYLICTQGNPGVLVMPVEGLLWGIASMVTMAAYILIPVNLLKRWSGLVVTAPCVAAAAVIAFVALRPWEQALPLNLPVALGVIGTAVFGVVIAYLCFMKGLKEAGPIVAGLLDCVEPVAALAFSASLLGTVVTGFDLVGCALILSMMVIVALPER